ncbi:carbohydrate kinase family protein [Patescibacteria group bacterium]|nr:carbohydrate kinase family protein [Patescibacteria group bacterium]
MHDIITVGDATIDTFTKIHDAEIRCSVNKEDCKLCVNYADKIPVDEIKHLVAGNAANNAIGSARLGLKAAIYVNVGDDDSGERIKNKIESEGVDGSYISVNKDMESNYSTVINFKGERTIFVYHQDWKYRLPDMEPTKWVYYTSVSDSFKNSTLTQDLADYVKDVGAKLLFNPGTYHMLDGVKKRPEILKVCTVFNVNVEEAKKILEIPPENSIDIKSLLKKTRDDLEVKSVVITDGRQGSYSFDGKEYYKLPEFPGDRTEATGAGDSFATALVASLFYGNDIGEAMVWGSINGAYVVKKVGPQAGLLHKHEMDKIRGGSLDFKAEKF